MKGLTMYADLYKELIMMKQELEHRLLQRNVKSEFAEEPFYRDDQENKNLIVQKHIRDDLEDVKIAIQKIENGTYGICEETGETIPFKNLRNLPTARNINDFQYKELVRV